MVAVPFYIFTTIFASEYGPGSPHKRSRSFFVSLSFINIYLRKTRVVSNTMCKSKIIVDMFLVCHVVLLYYF